MNDNNSSGEKKEKEMATISTEKSNQIKQSISENIIRISSAKNIQTSFGNKYVEMKIIKS